MVRTAEAVPRTERGGRGGKSRLIVRSSPNPLRHPAPPPRLDRRDHRSLLGPYSEQASPSTTRAVADTTSAASPTTSTRASSCADRYLGPRAAIVHQWQEQEFCPEMEDERPLPPTQYAQAQSA